MIEELPMPGPDEVVPWHWFLKCQKCGKPHQYRWLKTPPTAPRKGTWADPDDGHVYMSNGRHILIDLYPRWKAEQE